MNYDQAVINFLALPENLEVALDVAKQVERVKDHLLLRFWHQYRDEMLRRLQMAERSERWQILPAGQFVLGPYVLCSIAYLPPTKQALYINVALEANKAQWQSALCYGLRWSKENAGPPAAAMPVGLANMLKDLKYVGSPSPWWPMYINLDYRMRDDQFVLRFVNEPAELVNEISDIVWTLFEQTCAQLEVANDTIASVVV